MCSTPVCGILCGQRQSLAGAIPAGLCGILGSLLFHSVNNTKTALGPPHEVGCHNQRKQTARREIFREERSWRKGGWREKNASISYNNPKAIKESECSEKQEL